MKTLEKSAEQRNKELLKQAKREAAARSTQNTIKYKRMFEDGICEIQPGLYSRSIKFSDINYQIARYEEQKEIFSQYCHVLNYFDPSVFVQLSIVSRHIDKNDFNRSMLLRDNGDELSEYRQEMNDMLSEKALEGNNSILREKYLTFSTTASTYNAAVPTLSRIETDVTGNFKSIGCDAKSLNGMERIEVLHSLLRPYEPFTFDYELLLESSLTTKDFIAPDSFDFSEKNMYEFGENVGQTLYLKDLPADITDDLISDLSDIPCDMVITLHINSVEQDKALAEVKQKISFMEQQVVDEKSKLAKSGVYDDEMLPYELRFSHAEAKEFLDDLQNKNQRMFRVTMLVYTYAEDADTLNGNIYQIMATARAKNCKVSFLDYLQEKAMNSILPIGKNHIDIKRTLTTASTAIFVPFTTQELFQKGGIYYGQNALSHNLIFLNRKLLKNSNGFILGTPGSGKSFAAKREIEFVLLSTNDDVVVIDPEREYSAMCESFNGEIVHISAGSTTHINPFDLTMDYADSDDPLLLKSEFILSLCDLIAGGKHGFDGSQLSIIDRVCTLTYQEYFATLETNIAPSLKMPTLKDFYEVLNAQPEPEAKQIALSLELYIKGNLSVFAQPTNVDTNNRFVVYDIKDLGKKLKTLGMLVVLDQIWNKITHNRAIGKRTWIYIDEIYLLFQHEYSAQYLFELYKRARKWGAIPTGITQNVEDLLLSDTARRMLSNSDFIMMLNQAAPDRMELAGLLNISNQQLSFVTNAGTGQGLIFAGSAIVPFVDKFPVESKLYQLMTTKPEEIAAQQSASISKAEIKSAELELEAI